MNPRPIATKKTPVVVQSWRAGPTGLAECVLELPPEPQVRGLPRKFLPTRTIDTRDRGSPGTLSRPLDRPFSRVPGSRFFCTGYWCPSGLRVHRFINFDWNFAPMLLLAKRIGAVFEIAARLAASRCRKSG
jgi:hypothetical protein